MGHIRHNVWGALGGVIALLACLPGQSNAASLDKEGNISLGVRAYINGRIGTQDTDRYAIPLADSHSDPNFEFPAHILPDGVRLPERHDGEQFLDPSSPLYTQGPLTLSGGNNDTIVVKEFSRTFPFSNAGHLRQNRFFVEAELKHSLDYLIQKDFGPLALLKSLPFKVRRLRYGLTYRGEGDGLYDWGPSEFRTAEQYKESPNVLFDPQNDSADAFSQLSLFSFYGVDRNPVSGIGLQQIRTECKITAGHSENCELLPDIAAHRRKLRNNGTHRSRLFQAYLDGQVGDLWFRVGRQILAWGETDSFRLLDNINPTDSSFGGFLIPLDERRVPLDMLRLNYRLPTFGPFSEAYVEAYGAIDDQVGYAPGTAAGSPWTLPNSDPSQTTRTIIQQPSRSLRDMRGGGRLVWNMFDATFSIAHYYTYFDLPGVQVVTNSSYGAITLVKKQEFQPDGSIKEVEVVKTVRADTEEEVRAKVRAGEQLLAVKPDVGGNFPLDTHPDGYSAHAYLTAPKVAVTGISTTFAPPPILGIYPIVRSELAYFNNEPRYTQENMDPFLFTLTQRCEPLPGAPNDEFCTRRNTGGRLTGNSLNYALGTDINTYIRFLNPHQSFFISAQLFYKRLLDAAPNSDDFPFSTNSNIRTGEVLPVARKYVQGRTTENLRADFLSGLSAAEPVFVRQPNDQFLNTLLIATNYRSGTITPSLGMFFDWGGTLVVQPGVSMWYEPFRFAIDYSYIEDGMLKAGSGVSLLQDRDNVQFRLEYVI